MHMKLMGERRNSVAPKQYARDVPVRNRRYKSLLISALPAFPKNADADVRPTNGIVHIDFGTPQ
jgi:hypothetical protein